MTLIDDFIHSLIRKRFNLPAETPVEFEIVPGNDYRHRNAFRGAEENYTIYIYRSDVFDFPCLRTYDSWDEFVADMESGGDD